ncbi:hypothetical protein KUCAC02_033139, partial [Chaenocephalus aceratus]
SSSSAHPGLNCRTEKGRSIMAALHRPPGVQMAAVTVAGKTPTPRFIYDCVAPPHICILTPGAEMREEEKEHLEEPYLQVTWSLTLVIGDFNCQQQHHTEEK